MIKYSSGGKYGGVLREAKPRKYTGDNIVKREAMTTNTSKKYTFTVRGKGTITFTADSLEDAKRIAKSMGASVRTGNKK